MKGQRNFSIHVPSHGFENNEALVDGRCSGTGFGGSVYQDQGKQLELKKPSSTCIAEVQEIISEALVV